LAAVVSAYKGEREQITQSVLDQTQNQLGLPDLQVITTVVERRATFSCTPDLVRPPTRIGPGLWACGDHVQGPYPATLEGAVRSGLEVVDQLTQG
jgi:predicted NAD/FAD-dependent oxidoreductase